MSAPSEQFPTTKNTIPKDGPFQQHGQIQQFSSHAVSSKYRHSTLDRFQPIDFKNSIFVLLADKPELMEIVISFLQFPHDYLNIHPRLSHFIFTGSDKYFWLMFKIRIRDLFCKNIDEAIASTAPSAIHSFLELLYTNKQLLPNVVRQYLTYLAIVGMERQLLSLSSPFCFVTFCREYLLLRTMEDSLLNHSVRYDFEPIDDACSCDLHAAWIPRVRSQLLLQRDPFPESFLQWICHRYGYKIQPHSLEFSRLLIFFVILTQSVHVVFPDVTDHVLFLTFMRVFLDVNQELVNEDMVDDMAARLRAYYFPLHINRQFLDIDRNSPDMNCLKALSLETSMVALIFELLFTRKLTEIPDVYVDFFCEFFNHLNQWCTCKDHVQTAGVRLVEIIFLSTSPIPVKLMHHLVHRYGDARLCKELLICIGLQTPKYSEEMYLLITHCLMDKRVMRNFFHLGGERNLKKLHKWTKLYGGSSNISEIMRIFVLEFGRFKRFCVIYFLARSLVLFATENYLYSNFPNTCNLLLMTTICEMIAVMIMFMK